MPVISLPTGEEVDFPDGMSPNDMATAAHEYMVRKNATAANQNAGVLDNIARTIARGATLGYADELAAAGNATLHLGAGGGDGSWSDRYTRALESERARDADFDRTNPVLSGLGQMGGAVAGTIATPMVTPFKVGAAGMRGLAEGIGNTAATSALYGTVAGFGEGQDGLGSRLESAVKGGLIGGAGGAAMHGGLAAVGGASGRIMHILGYGDPDKTAQAHILRALERDGLGSGTEAVDALAARAQTAQAPQILPDLAGRNTVNLAAVAANTPGAAMEAADRVTTMRRAGGPDRVAAVADTAFGGGSGDDVARMAAALGDQRAQAAAPLYETAFARPVDMADARKVQRFVTDPIGQEALQRGMRVIELEHLARGKLFDPDKYGVVRSQDTGRWIIDPERAFDEKGATAPSFRLLDAVKRGYDDIVEGFRDPTTGKLNLDQYGRAVNDVRAAYRDRLAAMNPAYKTALEAWSGPSASLDALRRGQQALRGNRDVTAAAADRITEGDRPFFQMGAGRAVTDMASDPRNVPSVARRLTEDRQMQQRLQTILPDDMRRDYLVRALQREANMAQVTQAVSPRSGSQTMRLTAGAEDLANDTPTALFGRAVESGANSGLGAMAGSVMRDLYRRGQGINSATADALAKHLFNPTPEGIHATLDALRAKALSDALVRERDANVTQRLLSSVSAGASLEAH